MPFSGPIESRRDLFSFVALLDLSALVLLDGGALRDVVNDLVLVIPVAKRSLSYSRLG